MKSRETKSEFIKLRALGYSFRKISAELGVNKSTLLNWEQELENEIAQTKADELNAIYDEYALARTSRLKRLGELLRKLDAEIDRRDLSDLPLEKLLDLRLKYTLAARDEIIDTDINGVAPAAAPANPLANFGLPL